MNPDFTINTYKELLKFLMDLGFTFTSLIDYLSSGSNGNTIILRHDVDKFPQNSLAFAEIQNKLGLRCSYYFRIVPGSWDEHIIKQIALLGHEIGYHYEDISLIWDRISSEKRLANKNQLSDAFISDAFGSFKKNLLKLRKLAPVNTICMHGDPLSRWDSRLLWKYYDFAELDIKGEPYFSISFNDMLYLTDTGRSWNANSVAVRDKPSLYQRDYSQWKVKPIHGSLMNMSQEGLDFQNKYRIKSTFDFMNAEIKFPRKSMITFHPQRWTNSPLLWLHEFLFQNFKNGIKYFITWR